MQAKGRKLPPHAKHFAPFGHRTTKVPISAAPKEVGLCVLRAELWTKVPLGFDPPRDATPNGQEESTVLQGEGLATPMGDLSPIHSPWVGQGLVALPGVEGCTCSTQRNGVGSAEVLLRHQVAKPHESTASSCMASQLGWHCGLGGVILQNSVCVLHPMHLIIIMAVLPGLFSWHPLPCQEPLFQEA